MQLQAFKYSYSLIPVPELLITSSVLFGKAYI